MQTIEVCLFIVGYSFVRRQVVRINALGRAANFEPAAATALVLFATDIAEFCALDPDHLLAVRTAADDAHVTVARHLVYIINIVCHIAS